MYCSLADIKDRANERTKEILEAHQSLEEFQSVKGKVETEKKQIEGILKSIQSKVEETTVANSKLETTAEADKQRVVLETEAKAEAEMTYTLQTVKNPAKFKEPEMHMKKCKQEMANLSQDLEEMFTEAAIPEEKPQSSTIGAALLADECKSRSMW